MTAFAIVACAKFVACCLATASAPIIVLGLRTGPSCPTQWQHDYSTLHKSILEGSAAPERRRYAIAVSSPSGLADRLVGTIAVFYFALLTGRAFTICTGVHSQLPFETIYSAPHINWTTTSEHVRLLLESESSNDYNKHVGLPDKIGLNHQHWNLLNPERSVEQRNVFSQFASGNLSELGVQKDILFFTLNRGASIRLFDNPFHAHQLRDMGLEPGTAFGCAMDFLFQPVPSVMDMMLPAIQVLRPAISIGIHIRVGDHVFQGSDVTQPEDYDVYFKCAEHIEKKLKSKFKLKMGPQGTGAHIRWLLLSDSGMLRRDVDHNFGDKVYILPGTHVQHSFGNSDIPHATTQSFVCAASEHWLFGLTDFHVVGVRSGFGLSGTMRTFEEGREYVVGHEGDMHCQDLSVDLASNLYSGA